MKKTYSRPQLAFESYQLDAAIAQNCQVPIGYTTTQCSTSLAADEQWWSAGGEFFGYYNCQTDLVGNGPGGGESVCYHGPHSTWGISDIFLNSGL